MNDGQMNTFSLFLASSRKQQVMYILKTLSKDQLRIILEIFYNITNGIISISTKDKIKISKYKSIVRKILGSDLKWGSRKKLLWKIKHLVPIIILNYSKHVQRAGVNSDNQI